MGVLAMAADPLSERAAMMRESLQKSQTITDSVVSILGSFDHRLSALETAMRPTQVGPSSSSFASVCFSRKWKDECLEMGKFWDFVLTHLDHLFILRLPFDYPIVEKGKYVDFPWILFSLPFLRSRSRGKFELNFLFDGFALVLDGTD